MLVDSSVWIEDLRPPGCRPFQLLHEAQSDEIAVTQPVLMEVLAGAARPQLVESRLSALPVRPVDPDVDYLQAAAIYRAARRAGLTIRSLEDCLIAAVALRLGDTVVHRDQDFEHISAVTTLRTLDLRD